MKNNIELEYEEISWDIISIFNYIKEHYIKFFLLILVFIIIYVVDHISNINAMIFSMPSAIQGVNSSPIKLPKPKKNSKK